MTAPLPVADPGRVRRAALGELAADRRAVGTLLVLNGLAAAAGLAGPWLLGRVVDAVQGSGPRGSAAGVVDRLALGIVAATLAQVLLARWARYAGARFGERTAARVRERFLDRVLALPAAVVARVPTGDLVARGSGDVTAVATTLRDALPDVSVGLVQILFTVVAVLVVSPVLGACGLACLAVLVLAARWYLRRARSAYLAEGAATSALAEMLTATAAGARTVEALGLQEQRIAVAETAIADSRRTKLRTLALRNVLFPAAELAYSLPVVGVLVAGGVLYDRSLVTLGTVVAAAMYVRQLVGPLDSVLIWLEQIQSSGASYARVEGLAAAPRTDEPSTAEPAGDRIEVSGVRYAYAPGRDVLHGIDLTVRPGERLAVVGASGAGKSTLGRLIAGVDRPAAGTVTAGGVPVADLPPERLRRQVVLVTQEHHVFHDTVRDNLRLARPAATDSRLFAALDAVGAAWVRELPAGLDTVVGGGGYRLDGARAQQLALARVVLADPHTVVLDEATALLDPASARTAERALAAVLAGRTVIAIAHRLQTAHDADRVAVVDAGLVTEYGTHDELVATGGGYAALWRSWHGD